MQADCSENSCCSKTNQYGIIYHEPEHDPMDASQARGGEFEPHLLHIIKSKGYSLQMHRKHIFLINFIDFEHHSVFESNKIFRIYCNFQKCTECPQKNWISVFC